MGVAGVGEEMAEEGGGVAAAYEAFVLKHAARLNTFESIAQVRSSSSATRRTQRSIPRRANVISSRRHAGAGQLGVRTGQWTWGACCAGERTGCRRGRAWRNSHTLGRVCHAGRAATAAVRSLQQRAWKRNW